jgi:hypothetical protein
MKLAKLPAAAMPKLNNLAAQLPEVFLSDTTSTLAVTRLRKTGQLRKLAPRLYTTNLRDDPAAIVGRHAWQIVAMLAPGTVVSFRSALEMRPKEDGSLFVTGGYRRILELPGLVIRQQKGPGPLPGDRPFLDGLHIASPARALLENLMPTRQGKGARRSVGSEGVEAHLAKIAAGRPEKLNEIRDAAREIAPTLDAEEAFAELDRLVCGIYGSKPAPLATPLARAFAAGEGYDARRVECFAKLLAELNAAVFPNRPDPIKSGAPGPGFYNLAFFDAYFSNYIEGIRFPVDEAIDIVFNNRIPERRPADAHDVLGTYQVVGRLEDMIRVPESFEAFEALLRERHRTILAGRPERRPGEYKLQINQVGGHTFVEPQLVRGTLKQGYDFYRSLEDSMARALMMKFIVAEIHPFEDGNGRTARAMMNAELVAAGQRRIIIPSVYRNEYLGGLRRLSNYQEGAAYIRVMDHAQMFCCRVDFADLAAAEAALRACHAFEDPADEVKLVPPPASAATPGA